MSSQPAALSDQSDGFEFNLHSNFAVQNREEHLTSSHNPTSLAASLEDSIQQPLTPLSKDGPPASSTMALKSSHNIERVRDYGPTSEASQTPSDAPHGRDSSPDLFQVPPPPPPEPDEDASKKTLDIASRTAAEVQEALPDESPHGLQHTVRQKTHEQQLSSPKRVLQEPAASRTQISGGGCHLEAHDTNVLSGDVQLASEGRMADAEGAAAEPSVRQSLADVEAMWVFWQS